MQVTRLLIIVLIVFFTSNAVYAEGRMLGADKKSRNSSIAVSPHISLGLRMYTSISYGAIQEIVYPAKQTDNAYYSKLNWEIANVVFLGAQIEMEIAKKLGIQFLYATNIHKGNGNMENKDWYDADSSTHTHYSKSENNVLFAQSMRIEGLVDYTVIARKQILLALRGGMKYYKWNFEDALVSYSYPDQAAGSLDEHKGRTTVQYEVSLLTPIVGVGIEGQYRNWYIEGIFDYGFMGYIEATDTHTLRNKTFHDRIYPTNYISPSIYIGYQLGIVSLDLGFQYEKLFERRGYTTVQDGDNPEVVAENQSGSSFDLYSVILGINITYR